METRRIKRGTHQYGVVKKLFERAFPKAERLPMWLLLLLARRKGVDFEAYYDDDNFCGFSYIVENDDLAFILYLAVNDEMRSQGYGSRILECVKTKAGEKPIVLNIEPLDSNAENCEQRKRRLTFYEKNGYVNTGFVLRENKEKIFNTCYR